jgi:hypothetical protein
VGIRDSWATLCYGTDNSVDIKCYTVLEWYCNCGSVSTSQTLLKCCWRLYHTRLCVYVLTARLLTTLISLVISLTFQCWLAGYIATTILNVRINRDPQTIKTYLVESNSKGIRGVLAFGIIETINFRTDASTSSYLKQFHNPTQFHETVNMKFIHSI